VSILALLVGSSFFAYVAAICGLGLWAIATEQASLHW